LRWDPLPLPKEGHDLPAGRPHHDHGGRRGLAGGHGGHVYLITKSMVDQAFYNADGEMMFVLAQEKPAILDRIRHHRHRAGRDRGHSRAV
jgi:homogentisate 1,2-dioxygenase